MWTFDDGVNEWHPIAPWIHLEPTQLSSTWICSEIGPDEGRCTGVRLGALNGEDALAVEFLSLYVEVSLYGANVSKTLIDWI